MKPMSSRFQPTFVATGVAVVLCLVVGAPLLADSEYALRLGGKTFDPLVDSYPRETQWWTTPVGPDLQLVQFFGPTQQPWLDALSDAGAEIIQYIHPFTYVVWGDLSTLKVFAESEPSVRWVGHFQPAFRVLPEWRGGSAAQPRQALLSADSDLDLAIALLEDLGVRFLDSAWINQRFLAVRLQIRPTQLPLVARIPGIYTIQPEPMDGGPRSELSSQVNANNVDASNFAFPGYQNWLTGLGIDGSGVTIANVDEGLQDDHEDLAQRCVPCEGSTCGTATSDHGTFTAGIMVGDGSSGVEDANGFLRGLGVAPGALVVEQLYSPIYNEPAGMLALIRDSRINGALVSNNSWGAAGSPRGYDVYTMQVDIGVRDADDSTPGNQQLTYVLAMANGSGGASSQGSPDEAKNTLTVGSTKLQLSDGTQDPAIDDLSPNTGHGPALDGRSIPHLVAPGCMVDSTSMGAHDLLCGTSMAAPQISGAAALFIERYRNIFGGVDPTPALVKAAFLPVARDLAGHLDADNGILGHRFDSRQGWGRMDLAAVLDPQALPLYYDAPQILGDTGTEWTVDILAVDPSQPLQIMLVWTDAPGHGLGGATPAWNNDLDLVVEDGGTSYLGNQIGSDGFSVTGGTADGGNNTEGVFLPPGAERTLTVRVRAANITSDGVPGVGDSTDQDFALVCYNCSDAPRLTGRDAARSSRPGSRK